MNDHDNRESLLFWKRLAEIVSAPSLSPLRSEEALEAYLQAHPLSVVEETRIEKAVERLQARLSGRTILTSEAEVPIENLSQMSDSELVALHRNQGTLTPALEQRLEALRRRMREDGKKKKPPGGPAEGDTLEPRP